MSDLYKTFWRGLSPTILEPFRQLLASADDCLCSGGAALRLANREVSGSSQRNCGLVAREITNAAKRLEPALKSAMPVRTYPAIETSPTLWGTGAKDILTRVHTAQAHRRLLRANASIQDWLAKREAALNIYASTPRANGFEQNISGLEEAHLEQVEHHWLDHQLWSPIKGAEGATASCCAPLGSWPGSQPEDSR